MISEKAQNISPFIVMEVLERASELEKQGHSIIHLEVGEPDFDVPPCVRQATEQAIKQGRTHYTHSLGDPELREEISQHYFREYGVSVSRNKFWLPRALLLPS